MQIFKKKLTRHVLYRNFHSRRIKGNASYKNVDTLLSSVRNQNKASENTLSTQMVSKRNHDLYKNNIIDSGTHFGAKEFNLRKKPHDVSFV